MRVFILLLRREVIESFCNIEEEEPCHISTVNLAAISLKQNWVFLLGFINLRSSHPPPELITPPLFGH